MLGGGRRERRIVGEDQTGSLRAHVQVPADCVRSRAQRPCDEDGPEAHRGDARDLLRQDRDRWSDDEAEDQRHHENERRHPEENGALSCFGSEQVQLVSFTFHFSFTFHRTTYTPKGDVGF
jgi:hypothetical protein